MDPAFESTHEWHTLQSIGSSPISDRSKMLFPYLAHMRALRYQPSMSHAKMGLFDRMKQSSRRFAFWKKTARTLPPSEKPERGRPRKRAPTPYEDVDQASEHPRFETPHPDRPVPPTEEQPAVPRPPSMEQPSVPSVDGRPSWQATFGSEDEGESASGRLERTK